MVGRKAHESSATPVGHLRASPATAEAVAGADAIAFLVGSYDGSGNYGDIAQLDAALSLLDRVGADLLALPVIEQQLAAAHETLAGDLLNPPRHVLYFDESANPGDDGLVELKPLEGLDLALTYLYGGGFLNPSWGPRKLAMLRAVEEVAFWAGRAIRFATGQQVDPKWIASLESPDAEMLRRFELLAGRDDASAMALGELVDGPVPNSGDDAVGVLAQADPLRGPAEARSPLEVNVHIAEHGWVTDDPDSLRDFDLRLLAELARFAERPLRVRPLLAYIDPRSDERPGLARFAAACAEHRLELDRPLVLRPATLAEVAADLGEADLTISCSYHVALTSLLLGVPTAILQDNAYYAQKAAGLLADFGLPPEFSPSSREDPVLAARRIASHLFDSEQRGETRRDLDRGGAQARERRLATEKKLLSLIEGGLRSGGPRHEIAHIRTSSGELSFEARLEGVEPKQIWLRTSSEVEPTADAVLPTALMPAMRKGGELTVDGSLDPRLLRMQREFQAIQRAWSRDWTFDDPPLREVDVVARARPGDRRPRTGRVAAFFSGGVDSFSTVLAEEDVTDLIFVRGLDIVESFTHQEDLAERVERRLGEAAEELGLPLHVVDTNLRDLSEATGWQRPLARWETYYNSALAAVALFLEPLFDRILISTEFAYGDQLRLGASWMVDQLWGTENMEVVDVGGLQSRIERIEQIAANPVVQKTLRVCWQNPGGAYNCGRCRKCLLTMATLEAVGELERFETFPSEIDLDGLETVLQELRIAPHLAFCEEAYEATRRSGHNPDLEAALARLVAAGRKKLGRDGNPAAEAEARLEEVLGSRSWRITAPLRRLANRNRS